jgi:pilus assembly protein CpaE
MNPNDGEFTDDRSHPVKAATKLPEAEGREFLMSTFTHDPDALGAKVLSVALIGPQEQRRKAVANALAGSQASVTKEFTSYPGFDDVPRLLDPGYDVIIVELDSDPEQALDIVEHICGSSSATVMVYSASTDPELLVRCMRAGAREFLTQPIAHGTIAEALVRASVRRPAGRPAKKVGGKLFVFLGAKGGSGVTTVAGNFAVALAKESEQSTVLIDLDLPLGSVALDLGINAEFSTVNALHNFERLDANFLNKLLAKHSSGLSVLAAPDRYMPVQRNDQAVEKLLSVTRQNFEYVVVDAGTRLGPTAKLLLESASLVYLVTQVSIPELRNANRLINEFFSSSHRKLEVVLNRFTPRSLVIDEDNITKALTRPATWKIPNDYPAVRRAQDTATPLSLADSPISRVIRQMARAACNLSPTPDKKKRLRLFA